jgi:hypothetical protein
MKIYQYRFHGFYLLIISFVQVVPTIYTDIRGRKIYSNQVNILIFLPSSTSEA